MHFVSVHMVHPYGTFDTGTAWKKFRFISLDISDYYMNDNLSIAVHTFTKRMLTSLSVDEILLPRYANLSNDFSGLPLKVEMASFG